MKNEDRSPIVISSSDQILYSQEDDYVMLVSQDGKAFFLNLKPDGELQTHRGVLLHAQVIGCPWGACIESHLGHPFHVFRPTLRDVLLNTRRNSQIIYPKDIGYILLRLSVGPGARVLEAGTGSGALTTAFSWSVGSSGEVFSYDRRDDMQDLARKNLNRVGLGENVTYHLQDIAEGFVEDGIEAIFLDLPNPNDFMAQVTSSLLPGGTLGAIVPTANQVSPLLIALRRAAFDFIDVCEILIRFYKPVPERFRPEDRMIAHTGFLVFARLLSP
jgi:tRNA (adenine57-N1/adenine58-N1)-methyltransferase